MSDQDPTGVDPGADEPVEQPVEAPAATQEREWWMDQFGTTSREEAFPKMAESYVNLREKLSSTRPAEQQPEPEPEPQADPLDFLPPHIPEETWQQIAAYAQSPHGGPEKAFRQVWENRDWWGNEVPGALWQNWAQNDPIAANRFLVEEQNREWQQNAMQQMYQQFAPVMQHTSQTVASNMEEILKREAPIMATREFGTKIADWLEAHPQDPLWNPQVSMNPEAAAERVMEIGAQILSKEKRKEWFSLPAPPEEAVEENGAAKPDPREKAKTTNRSTAARATTSDNRRKQIRATLGIPEDAHPS